MAGIHKKLKEAFPELLTFLVPASPSKHDSIINHFYTKGLKAQMWTSDIENCTTFLSCHKQCTWDAADGEVDAFVIDPSQSADVLALCSVVEIVFVGSSLISGMKGNTALSRDRAWIVFCLGSCVAQACISNCAVIVGKHTEDISQMIGQSSPALQSISCLCDRGHEPQCCHCC